MCKRTAVTYELWYVGGCGFWHSLDAKQNNIKLQRAISGDGDNRIS